MTGPSSDLRASFERDGFVVARSLLPRDGILELRSYAELLVPISDNGRHANNHVQTAFNEQGAPKLLKVSGLAERDQRFRALATDKGLVDIVETLIGANARRFRDVLVVKPGRSGGALSYHQDSAYWDVEPKALVSAWVALGDVPADASCLSVIPATHTHPIEHGLFLKGRHKVPSVISRSLRRMVSFAGTGDNPKGTGGNELAWKAKRWLLAEMTKTVPRLFDLQDFRVPPSAIDSAREQFLPVDAGDVIFFHSLLWHASGPNTSDNTRYAEIISFMGSDARFVGKGAGHFPLARTP